MSEIEQCFCPNKQCKDYGQRSKGNIAIRGKYGKDKNRNLLYCRTCGKRFAATQASALFGLHLSAETIRQIIHHTAEGVGVRATARLLGMDKDTVNRVILRAGEHCARVLSDLLASLELTEAQLASRRFVGNLHAIAAVQIGRRMLPVGNCLVGHGPDVNRDLEQNF